MSMLGHIKEIQPLFQKFGVATISDVLAQELKGVKRRPASASVAPKTRRNVTSHLRAARRTYVLQETGSHNVRNYSLPVLSIHEGSVTLDGKTEPRALIDASDRAIRWTRPVPEHGYEHGFVDISKHGLSGHGVVALSSDPDLEKLPSQSSQDHKIVQFFAAKPNASVNVEKRELDHEKLIQTVSSVSKTATAVAQPSAKLASAKPVSIPGLNLQSTSSVGAKADPPVNQDYIDNEDYWDMVLDQAVWPVGQPRTSPVNPMPFGQVAFATYHAGGATGLSVPILMVPALDTLLEDINKSKLSGQAQLDSLYSSMVEITSEGKQMGTIYLDSAAVLYELADKATEGGNLPSLFNLTFKSIGSSVTLPLLFRTLGVELSRDFSSALGSATEYDASNRGGDGDR